MLSRASGGKFSPPQTVFFARSFVSFPVNFAYAGMKALK